MERKKSPEKRSGRATRKLKNIRPQQRTEKAPKKRKKHQKKTQQKKNLKPPEKYRSKIAENQSDWVFSLSYLC